MIRHSNCLLALRCYASVRSSELGGSSIDHIVQTSVGRRMLEWCPNQRSLQNRLAVPLRDQYPDRQKRAVRGFILYNTAITLTLRTSFRVSMHSDNAQFESQSTVYSCSVIPIMHNFLLALSSTITQKPVAPTTDICLPSMPSTPPQPSSPQSP